MGREEIYRHVIEEITHKTQAEIDKEIRQILKDSDGLLTREAAVYLCSSKHGLNIQVNETVQNATYVLNVVASIINGELGPQESQQLGTRESKEVRSVKK